MVTKAAELSVMKKAPIPPNESKRQAAVDKLNIVDTPPEERFDRITDMASRIFSVPISTITIIDHDREWYKSCVGLPEREGDRAISFCGHCVLEKGILNIPDATKDPRFADNPSVTGDPFIKFYAGVPLAGPENQQVGTLCIIDTKPRTLSDEEVKILKNLAMWAEREVNNSRAISKIKSDLDDRIKEIELLSKSTIERESRMVQLKKELKRAREDLKKVIE